MDNLQLYLFWPMMGLQMVAWAWLQKNGGTLEGKKYLWFCGGMMLGQLGASGECIMAKAWGTLVVQLYFFAFTAYGAYQRNKQLNT
jgi:hypothetical protein